MQGLVEEQAVWRVLYTRPRAEKKAFETLEKQGFTVYLPCVTVLKQWSDRKKKVLEPLFRSYLFAKITACESGEIVRDANIVGFVRFGTELARVREDEMQMIRRIVEGYTEVVVIDHKLEPGQKIKITKGPLKGHFGTLMEIRGAQKLVMEIESLATNIMFTVPGGNVEIFE